MNVMIFGTSYVDSQERKWLADRWVDINLRLNGDCSVGMIDTKGEVELSRPEVVPFWYQFSDNIGHLSRTGRDGWGRSFIYGIQGVINGGWADYVVHIECDILFARPVMPIIERMERFGIKALSTWAHPYGFIETGIMFLNVAWLREIDFIRRYDWENPPPPEKLLLPERRVELILGDELLLLPLRGMRDDFSRGNTNLRAAFPYGIEWLTHSTVACYRQFLEMNGLSE